MNKVIIIYNGVPEWLKVFNLDVSDEDLARIKRCNGCYVNTTCLTKEQEADTDWLYAFLEDKKSWYSEDEKDENLNSLSCSEPCTIVVTGFIF